MFPQIFGKYVLERELSSGGMARVYLATLRGAVGFEKRLVVKQIRPELSLDEAFVRRFVEEAKIAVELSHPNIVPVYELGVEQGTYYIAMELCEGLTLTEVLADTGPLDAAEGAHVGIEICRALDYAHRRGNVVHRDVTPRNVLVDEEGAVRLIDFGIAAPVSPGPEAARIEVFGSPGHMPPEQLRGQRLSPATDVFAVGVLLIEAWTGRPPFRRGSFEASARALEEPPASLANDHPELSPIAEIIAQAVALSASERPQEAEALARKLRDFSRQFDRGDVAKRLGARVERARRRARSSVPWLPGDSAGPLTPATPPLVPSTPSTSPMSPPRRSAPPAAPVTRTFAARDDLVEWTRKIGSIAPPSDDAAPIVSRKPAAAWGIGVAVAAVLGVVALLGWRGSDRPKTLAHAALLKVGTPAP
ncbi:MAG TPA: serine/threonine-protein kinase, partial [Polyangiaceae bacterium]|nr:serine/threonine-protein kinase [Polyangiaceae bacterium]